jgi:hypothetical protein
VTGQQMMTLAYEAALVEAVKDGRISEDGAREVIKRAALFWDEIVRSAIKAAQKDDHQ